YSEIQAVACGEVSDICIGGPGVARGYVKRPDENRERFVPDPFVKCAGVRIYRSGDLGRMDSDGNIRFVGRGDSQVKLRGFRIELAEIESVMLEAPNVRAAACGVHEDHAGVQQLIAYVVSREGDAIQSEDLRKLLRDRLPSFMVPAIVETVDALPRLPNGRLDRASLPAPKARDAAPRGMDARPRTEMERRIAQVWETLFHPQPVSVDDHFFLDLGGHSLLVARLVSELRKHRQFAKLSVTDVYDYPTIASLAAAIEKASHQPRTSEPVETPT